LCLRWIYRAPAAISWAQGVERNGANGSGLYEQETKRQQEINDKLIAQSGNENQYKLHEEMGRIMTDNVTVVRYNDRLKHTDDQLRDLMDRYQRFRSTTRIFGRRWLCRMRVI